MASTALDGPPDHIERTDVDVLERSTVDDLQHIRAVWPAFEEIVGLRGRKMYARVDEQLGTYTVCTPLMSGDDPAVLGLAVGRLAGGRYLRGRISGAAPQVYDRIGTGMAEVTAAAHAEGFHPDVARPLVEFYRRLDRIELWLPVLS